MKEVSNAQGDDKLKTGQLQSYEQQTLQRVVYEEPCLCRISIMRYAGYSIGDIPPVDLRAVCLVRAMGVGYKYF